MPHRIATGIESAGNLIQPPNYPIYFLREKDVLQSSKTGGGSKSHGGHSQGSPQPSGGRSRTKAGITCRQWSQMAHHQFQKSRSCDGQMGIAFDIPPDFLIPGMELMLLAGSRLPATTIEKISRR